MLLLNNNKFDDAVRVATYLSEDIINKKIHLNWKRNKFQIEGC